MGIEADKAIQQIAALLQRAAVPRVPFSVQHWSLQTIAESMEVSEDQAARWAAEPDFPKAVRIKKGSHPRWRAAEVVAWFDEHKDRR